ncbi:MAG: hypothetical protein ABEL51_08115 [Salinibacter sp.]
MQWRVRSALPSLRLIGVLSLVVLLAGALTTASAQNSAVGVQSFADRIQFQAQSEDVERVQLEVFNLSGQVAYASDWAQGQSLSWNLQTETGRDVANGVYLYVLRTKDAQGATD